MHYLHSNSKKVADKPETEITATDVNLQVCILALLKKVFKNGAVIIQEYVKLEHNPFITEANDMFDVQ